MPTSIFRSINRWVLLGAIVIVLGLCGFSALAVEIGSSFGNDLRLSTAKLVIIPAPTTTPTYDVAPSETPLPPLIADGIQVGVYVQITGTEGVGLRIRSGPGKNFQPEFSGYDSEVFLVKDGPIDADGIIWWNLTAPYDSSRSGWGAANYLKIVDIDQ